MTGVLNESQVVKIWQEFLPGQTDLVTEEGEEVRVVYPGRPNDDRGADLRDAVIATSRGVRRGDIEIHVNSSSWWGHRHHQDPLYNRVILHVVYRHNAAAAAVLENGQKVPTLALQRYIGERDGRFLAPVSPPARPLMPCRAVISGRDTDLVGGILDIAGERRFAARAAEFRAVLLDEGAGQSLYRGIMGALGYTKNKTPMMELARRMPLDRLTASVVVVQSDDEYLCRHQALLVGAAGLLPSQRAGGARADDAWVDRLEEAWAVYGDVPAVTAGDWRFFKVRPGNLPVRRIAAMSYLLRRYRRDGLLAGLVHELEEALLDNCQGDLEGALLVAAEGYWGRHLNFGMLRSGAVPALLGVNRAGVVTVNVLLPFAVAFGEVEARPGLVEKALEMYRRHPVLPVNTLEKHMSRQLGIGRYPVSTARRQQGLIHIFKTYCSQGRCGECPLN
jgi:hypothetical protein